MNAPHEVRHALSIQLTAAAAMVAFLEAEKINGRKR